MVDGRIKADLGKANSEGFWRRKGPLEPVDAWLMI